jgi:hypothetical protein
MLHPECRENAEFGDIFCAAHVKIKNKEMVHTLVFTCNSNRKRRVFEIKQLMFEQ